MKPSRVLSAFCLAAVVTGCAAGASESAAVFTPQDSMAVRTSVDNWIKATLERDTALFRTVVANDVIMYPGNANPIRGADAAVSRLLANPPFASFVVDVKELKGYASEAYNHGTFSVGAKMPDGTIMSDTGSFMARFTKGADGRWTHQWVIWHSNKPPVPAPVTPAPARRRGD